MKRFLFVIVFCLLFAPVVSAQDKLPVRFEVGAGFAPLFLMGVEDSFEVPYKLDAYFEARYDLDEYIDLGLQADYKFNPVRGENPHVPVTYTGNQHYGALIATAGLKIPVNEQFLFFAGMGFGPGIISRTGFGNYGPFLVVAPRIGAQLYNHLRLSITADLTTDKAEEKAQTRWPVCFNIGWTF